MINVSWFFVLHRIAIAKMARERGVDVHIACGEGEGGRDDIEKAGFPFHGLPLTRTRFAPWQDLKSLIAIFRLYRKLRPDIVHHVTLKPIVLGSIAAKLAGVPGVINAFAGLGSVYSGRSWSSHLYRMVLHVLMHLSLKLPRQKVVFENGDDRTQLTRAGSVSEVDSLVIAGVGVDTSEFCPAPEPAAPVLVLMAGRMLREKGVVYFVDAARRLRNRGLPARFLLVGIPDPFNPRSITEDELRAWSSEGIVEWLGYRHDMPQVVRDSHIVCLPTYYREGVPRILIEGAASARPLVTTDMPGCRDIVQDGINGIVVPPHDVDALEAALGKLISDAGLRARFGAEGRRIAEQQFALPLVLEKFWELYLAVGLRA